VPLTDPQTFYAPLGFYEVTTTYVCQRTVDSILQTDAKFICSFKTTASFWRFL
jgi:hypothetical protein